MTTAAELDQQIREIAKKRKAELAVSVDLRKDKDAITSALMTVLFNARSKCIKEMCNDLVLSYTITEDFSVVDYGKLRQMGLALGIVKQFNKEERAKVQYGEYYFHTEIIGLSKLTVHIVRKRKWLFW